MSESVMLHGFGGGSGVNLRITAYAKAADRTAAKPQENTIGIVTANAVTGSAFCPAAPGYLYEGLVWIQTGLSSAAAFDALPGGNVLMIYPQSAKQYVNKAWKSLDAQSFIGGKWVPWNIAIVADGKVSGTINTLGVLPQENGGYTGSLTVAQNSADVTITFHPGTGGGGSGAIAIFGEYDLTAFKTLTFEGSIIKSNDYAEIGIGIWKNTNGTYLAQNRVKALAITGTKATMDVSALSGKHYVGFYYNDAFTMTHKITGLRLEN